MSLQQCLACNAVVSQPYVINRSLFGFAHFHCRVCLWIHEVRQPNLYCLKMHGFLPRNPVGQQLNLHSSQCNTDCSTWKRLTKQENFAIYEDIASASIKIDLWIFSQVSNLCSIANSLNTSILKNWGGERWSVRAVTCGNSCRVMTWHKKSP